MIFFCGRIFLKLKSKTRWIVDSVTAFVLFFSISNLFVVYFSIFDQKKLMIQRVQKVVCRTHPFIGIRIIFIVGEFYFERMALEQSDAGIFHYGKVFRVEPKGIFVNKLAEKRVHMKATCNCCLIHWWCCWMFSLAFARYGLQWCNNSPIDWQKTETRKVF